MGTPANTEMGVLIAEGVPGERRALGVHLRDRGVDVSMAGSVHAARDRLGRSAFHVVVVDLELPDGSGLDVIDMVRGSGSEAHVIVLSDSTADVDRLSAFEHGANAFVVKPFLVRQLAARVLAVRRVVDPTIDTHLYIGTVVIDLQAREAHIDERSLDLTAKEFDLLAYLAARPGHVFTKAELLRTVWRDDRESGPKTVARHVSRLRNEIEENPSRPRILQTVRGTGYRVERLEDDKAARSITGSLVHVDGCIVEADHASAILLGFDTVTELVGLQILDFATSAEMAPLRQRMTAHEPGLRPRTQLVDLDRTDGTQTSVEVAAEPLMWQGEKAERLRFTHMPDVSARLRRLVTGVLSEVTDAVIITDLHFHLRSWNSATERLYGWRPDEVMGRHILDIVNFGSEADGAAFADTWQGVEASGQWRGKSTHMTRDGSAIEVLTSTTLVRDDDGTPVLIVSVNRPAVSEVTTREARETVEDEEIRIGLANDQFEVHYQPVVSLADGAVVSVEALVRWNHPARGVLAPDTFIAAAERSGAIVELGYAVLEKACAQTVQWRQEGHRINLAVNLSGRQLAQPGLVEHITAVLSSSGLEAGNLWLEVTETALVEEIDRAGEVLYRLADLGVGISIDDFGTGWASLTYLRSFPVHALKIDRSFVAGVGRNINDTAIARSILELGADLGLFVVAEGIETVAQQKVLQKLGCTVGQGFLYGRPTPASEVVLGESHGDLKTSTMSTSHRTGSQLSRVPPQPKVDLIRRLSAAQIVAVEEQLRDGSL